ncbi:transposase [Candidatus Poribacteria bacterium]|nr:transposase [Candidatus Poribacteria bacterium]
MNLVMFMSLMKSGNLYLPSLLRILFSAETHLSTSTFGVEPSEVHIAIETPHGLMVHALCQPQYQIYPLNPKAVKRFRETYKVSGAKDDKFDAFVLAHLLRTHLSSFPTAKHACHLKKSELACFLKEQGYTRPNRLEGIYHSLQTPQLEASEVLIRAKARQMQALVAQLKAITVTIKEYDKALQKLLERHKDTPIFFLLATGVKYPGCGFDWPVLGARGCVSHATGNSVRLRHRTRNDPKWQEKDCGFQKIL